MSKPFTDVQFSDLITQDRTWRVREISDLKTAVEKADDALRRVLLRALVAICYAHWEGYIRFSARKYMEYVARRKLQYGELAPQFLRNRFLPRLAALSLSNTSVQERSNLVGSILTAHLQRYSRPNDDLVDTKSNLNTKVMSEICLVCSLPDDHFMQKSTFIDLLLLKRRNSIAHGEDTLVDFDDLDSITDGTLELMRAFGDALENQVALGKYRA